MSAVCVYCSSSDTIDPAYIALAGEVGTALAGAGYGVVSGGGRVSMMGALARAARAGGAHTVGVIPRHLTSREVADDDADELIVVDTMRERKRIMESRADAFLALPGGLGTLEELFEMWTSRTLGMHDKPVVVLDPDGFFAPLWAWLDDLAKRGFVRPDAVEALVRASSVDEVLAVLAMKAS